MQPLPQTAQVLHELSRTCEHDLEPAVRALADAVAAIVPSLVGFSIAIADGALTLAFITPTPPAAAGDAGAPVAPSSDERDLTGDVLAEERWQHLATAAAAENVRSTLSMPLTLDGLGHGSLDLYAAHPDAFDRTRDALLDVLGPGVRFAVTNADLPFRTRSYAQDSLHALHDLDAVEQAVGYLIARDNLDPGRARRTLQEAATSAGTDLPTAARAVLRTTT